MYFDKLNSSKSLNWKAHMQQFKIIKTLKGFSIIGLHEDSQESNVDTPKSALANINKRQWHGF